MYKKRDYAANYFFKAEAIIKQFNPDAVVTLQFFQRHDDALLGGMNEVLDLLTTETDTSKYIIRYLPEGSIINNKEVVLELEGRYADFGVYEGMIDGILARSTSIATNAKRCLAAANGKTVVFMGDRSDHYCNQERDGIAVELAGIKMHSTNAGAQGNADVVFGSIPHALIQNFNGDLLTVMQHYATLFPEDQDLVALVDFNNDVIADSLKVLAYFGPKLKGVRVDTSKSIRDKMFPANANEYGVTPNQIKQLRKALDQHNGQHVRIIVSSGFTPEKIAEFEAVNTPVDAYGVGEYIMGIRNFFSADATKINGVELAKVGRKYQFNPRLVTYKK
ncbi:nicotinate phosphoribosyltransferase [Mycoplasmoides fastidiosum]|uniref:Nicotinate phosphoribosyltransferase n=1 Tax=Mycoplasmoides fastidiosum TaxID=92758 RepID=A0ABU0LZW4_9BACT|nr:nicotinate phosphoribosyltransferase [Mycoplasmoides fastidiosum]MDQ0514234.1 nicotinate phosphoribosyltransferase [Mycoplasmoides fastidiosum]UUD37359.1 nicotinate phosphoribosyltransferase [Mycoplasmoides fastidiosum]